MPTVADADAAMLILKAYLVAQFAGDHAAAFEPYAVRVLLEEDYPTEAEQTGGPYILLRNNGEADADWGIYSRAVAIGVEANATEFSGAAYGAANPTTVTRRLWSTLTSIINEGYAELRDLGLLGNTLSGVRQQQRQGAAEITHQNTHEFRCVILTQ